MARSSDQIIADIRVFELTEGYWLPLDHLAAELWTCGAAGQHLEDLLAVFERFPDEAGGVLWGILHGLESLPGYESALVRSLQTRPSYMAVLMVGRLLNGGVSEVGGVSLVGLLREVALTTAASPNVRESAAAWVQRHAE